MATTIGVKLYYGTGVDGVTDEMKEQLANGLQVQTAKDGSTPGVYVDIDNQLYGVQNIPELQTAPSQIDTTSLEDVEEQSEPGLISGSSLQIVFNYKEGVYEPEVKEQGEGANKTTVQVDDGSNFEKCLDLANDDKIYPFKIVMRNGRWFAFYAKVRTTLGAMALASAQQFTMSLYKKSQVMTGWNKPETTSVSALSITSMQRAKDIVTPEIAPEEETVDDI